MYFFTRKRMNMYFISLYELANIQKEPPSIEVGTHYMKVSTMSPMIPKGKNPKIKNKGAG